MPLQIKVVGNPVVFTNNAGGGDNEIQAPQSGTATKQLHAGGQVRAAWYYATDNIDDLPKINRIACEPNGNHVNLIVGGQPNHPDGRVRIIVLAAVET